MNEHTTPPTSAHRHPRALFGRMQIYAQNHPRGYAVRAVFIGFPLLMLPPLLLCTVLIGEWSLLWPMLLGALVPLVIMGAVLIAFMPWFVRRMVGTSTLPPETDPVDLLEAKRQLRRGGLHESDEVNQVARIVAAQAEFKINSPRTLLVVGAIGSVSLAGLALLTYLSQGAGFDFWFRLFLAVLLVVYCLGFLPWVKRYRQRARDFASLYDAHRQERRWAV